MLCRLPSFNDGSNPAPGCKRACGGHGNRGLWVVGIVRVHPGFPGGERSKRSVTSSRVGFGTERLAAFPVLPVEASLDLHSANLGQERGYGRMLAIAGTFSISGVGTIVITSHGQT